MEISIGVSLEREPVDAAKAAIVQAKSTLHNRKIDLAIVLSSTDLSSPSLLKAVSIFLSGVPLVGCSGAAIITPQGIFKHGLLIMLITFPEGTFFNIAALKNIKIRPGFEVGQELGDKLLYGFENLNRSLSIIFSDALIEENTNLINGIQSKLGKSFPVIGGSASDNLYFVNNNLYYNHDVFNDGCVGILLGGKINFGLGVRHGWKPIGKAHTVTLANNNLVETIDDAPAVQLYEDYLGYTITRLKKELKNISIFYPIGLYLPGEEEYLLRNVLSVENNGRLRFQGNVPQGSTIRLMVSTKETCFAATQQASEEAKKSLFNPLTEFKKERGKKFVLVFSSISRYLLLKRYAHQELEIIKEQFGPNTPVIGLYTHGELAPLMAVNYLGQVHFHNQTMTILTIGS